MKNMVRLLAALLFTVAAARTARALPVPQVQGVSVVAKGIATPVRIAPASGSGVYVSDPRAGGIVKLDASGSVVQVIPTARPAAGVASVPLGLLVTQGDYVAVLDAAGKEKGRLGSGAGQFAFANSIAVDGSGYIYVVDSLQNAVKVFRADGTYAFSFGTSGSGAGQFSMPTGIAWDRGGNRIAVVDTLNSRIQFFSTSGSYLGTVGSAGSGPLKFTSPQGVAFEAGPNATPGRMYVSDSFQGTIQAIDVTTLPGTFLGFVGQYGTDKGNLMNPTDVWFDAAAGRLIAANGFGNLTLFTISPLGPVDTTPPVVAIATVPSATSSPSITISGTVEAGAKVMVTVGSSAPAAATVTGTSWTYSTTLSPGANPITVSASDAAGNTATASASITYVTSAVAVAINQLPQYTKNSSITVSGTRESGSTVSVSTNVSAVAGTVTYPTATTWNCTVSALPEGEATITASASAAGGRTGSVTSNVVVDRTAPVIALSTVGNGAVTATRVLNVSGVVTETNLDSVSVNGSAVRVTAGSFTTAVTLATGTNSVALAAADKAGNIATATRTVTWDPAAVNVALDSPADGAHVRNSSITVSGSVDRAATVTAGNAAVQQQGTAFTFQQSLQPGMNTIVVSAADGSGSSVVKRTIYLDPASPEVAATAPGADRYIRTPITTITAVSDTAATITAEYNGQTQTITGNSGDIPLLLPQEGAYPVTITATDGAGTSSTTIRTLVLDRTAPVLTLNQKASDAPTVLDGTVEAGALITVLDKNGVLGTFHASGSSWNFTIPAGADLASALVAAEDEAGNVVVRSLDTSLPDGDLNRDGKVDVRDAIQALKIAAGSVKPSKLDMYRYMAYGDVAPLLYGKPAPDGRIDMTDALLILRKAVKAVSW